MVLMPDYEYDWISKSVEEIRKDYANAVYGYVDGAVPRKTSILEWGDGRVTD